MKITLSLSNEAISNLDPNSKGKGMGYMGSRFLAETFSNRGHLTEIIFPDNILTINKIPYVTKKHIVKENKFITQERTAPLEGDIFFVYSLNEERGSEASKLFMETLYSIEPQYNHMVNSAESTSYEDKSKQKTLEFPWIPTLDIESKKDLTEILESENEILIAKPKVGACGMGIRALSYKSNLKNFDLNNYTFEKYIPSNEERRYIFLNGECILKRKMQKSGMPGKEICTNVTLTEGNPKEQELARRLINQTKMFYGAVDFRENYILELNGSGTGVAPPTIKNEYDSYNLSDPIVQAIEKLK